MENKCMEQPCAAKKAVEQPSVGQTDTEYRCSGLSLQPPPEGLLGSHVVEPCSFQVSGNQIIRVRSYICLNLRME